MIVFLVLVGSLFMGFLLYKLLTYLFPSIMKKGRLHEPAFTLEDVKAASYVMIGEPFIHQPDSLIRLQIEEFCNEQGFHSAVEVYGNTAQGFCLWYQEKTMNIESHRRLKIRNGGWETLFQATQKTESYRKLFPEEIEEAIRNLHPDSNKIYMLDFSPIENDSNITMVIQSQQGVSEADMIKAFNKNSKTKLFPSDEELTEEELRQVHYSKLIKPDDSQEERTD